MILLRAQKKGRFEYPRQQFADLPSLALATFPQHLEDLNVIFTTEYVVSTKLHNA